MTEPVAYMWKTERGTIIGFTPNDNSHSGGQLGIPLYTAEQLHPRVKMTQAEFDEWKDLYNRSVMFSEASEITDLDNSYNYENIRKKIWVGNRENNIENEAIFARLYADFDPDNPEETIEIVPDMKWFVRSKKTNGSYQYDYLSRFYAGTSSPKYGVKNLAIQFDTKEEAEKWTNPLTEAMQLPVEGE